MWLIYNNGHPNYILYDWFKIYLHLNCRFQKDIELKELKDLDMPYQQDTNCIKILLEESNNQVGMIRGVESRWHTCIQQGTMYTLESARQWFNLD